MLVEILKNKTEILIVFDDFARIFFALGETFYTLFSALEF
jgi:hypothetical protein